MLLVIELNNCFHDRNQTRLMMALFKQKKGKKKNSSGIGISPIQHHKKENQNSIERNQNKKKNPNELK